jgi:dTDP-4-amino-4,6-dideoxygalactose transaminase
MDSNLNNNKLAINGGEKAIKYDFKKYNSIGKEELDAASSVIEGGNLSQFIGADDKDFLGGPKVKEFEKACCEYFKVKHAITVNSWTSGLIAAVGALDIEPGDEIIVPTWTMCASATAILHWNAIPVFADIEDETFNIDPKSIEKNISPRTKAIMSVDIFGHSADMIELNKIAKKHNLKIISDTAQAPAAIYNKTYASTLSDIGGFSLNYHKHIHTGEGGVLVTNDSELAQRMQLIRNHAEAAVNGMGVSNIANMLGYNFRLGEVECAIGIEQLKKLKGFVSSRQKAAKLITEGLTGLEGLRTPIVKEGSTHVYYVYPLILDTKALGVPRKKIFEALKAEGVEGLAEGYANIHMLPMYQQKIAYGKKGFPWNSDFCDREIKYEKGICPVAEKLHDETFLGYEMCLHELSEQDVELLIKAFKKVWMNIDTLR